MKKDTQVKDFQVNKYKEDITFCLVIVRSVAMILETWRVKGHSNRFTRCSLTWNDLNSNQRKIYTKDRLTTGNHAHQL